MKKVWTVQEALKAVTGSVNGKVISYSGKGTKGLSECGALDFLKNHAGYTVVM